MKNIICTQEDLDEFLIYGLLILADNKYYDRNNNLIMVNLEQPKNFNINLSGLISSSLNLASKYYIKRIYCMTENTYNKYKKAGLIISKNSQEYYCKFKNEEWLVNKY